MSFQKQVNVMPPRGKQNMHLIGYVADNTNCNLYIRSDQITDNCGAIDRGEVMRILLSKSPENTEILLLAVSDIGLQESDI